MTLCCALMLYASIGTALDFIPTQESRPVALAFAGFFGAFAVGMLLEFHVAQIRVSPEGLHQQSPWRRQRFIPWDDILGCTYSELSCWHIVRTRRGKLHLSDFMPGSADLAVEIRRLLASPPRILGHD
jgi:hypothetical protein